MTRKKLVLALFCLSFCLSFSALFGERGQTSLVAGFSRYDGDGNSLPSATFNQPKDIAVSGGFMYIADTSNNAIRKVNMSNGVVTTLAGNKSGGDAAGYGTAARFSAPTALCADPTGNTLYVADTGNSRIKGINAATGLVYNISGIGYAGYLDGSAALSRFSYPMGIAADPTGRYVYVSDTSNYRIRRIDMSLNTVDTVAGAVLNGYQDGSGTSAKFNFPQGIDINDSGTIIYVADTWNQCVRKVDLANNTACSLVAGNTLSSYYVEGTGNAAGFFRPADVSLDNNANVLYVADTLHNMIRKIDLSTGATSPVAGTLTAGSINGIGTAALFSQPNGVFFSQDDGKVYVADTVNSFIRDIYPANSNSVTRFCGMSQYDGDGNTLPSATFNAPSDVAVNTLTSRVYIADSSNHVIRMIDENGVISTIAGDGKQGYNLGIGAVAEFSNPKSIALDPLDNRLYVSDTNNNRIMAIDLADPNYTVSLIAGSGAAAFNDATGSLAAFKNPAEIDVDYIGKRVFVADAGNNRIRMITLSTGAVTTVAGKDTTGYSTGQTIGTATFMNPEGIVYHAGSPGQFSDGLFIADTGHNMIRRLPIGSSVTVTVADITGLNSSPSYVDGVLTSARFYNPSRVTLDFVNWMLYVSDSNNHAVRSVELWVGGQVTTIGGNGTAGYSEGVSKTALFNAPLGMFFMPDTQMIYIADELNNNIRLIDAYYPTCTPTLTNTPTPTWTLGYTLTITPTYTETQTFTPVYSPTATQTATQTSTVSDTATVTPTMTATLTATVSSTASDTSTNTHTRTATPTPTISATGTISATATFTPSQSATMTVSPTESVTETAAATGTSTATATESPVYSPTYTPSYSPTYTITVTATAQTFTATATNTATATVTATATLTNTPTLTDTLTITDTATMTRTPGGTQSYTPTMTHTAQATATETPVDFFEKSVFINDFLIYPNPSFGRLKVVYDIIGQAREVNLSVYTPSFRLVWRKSYSNVTTGRYEPLFDDFKKFSCGVYHVLIECVGVKGDKVRRTAEMVIIR